MSGALLLKGTCASRPGMPAPSPASIRARSIRLRWAAAFRPAAGQFNRRAGAEHQARNAGPDQRVVLLFEIWRPEICEEDRAAISRVFEAIGAYGT